MNIRLGLTRLVTILWGGLALIGLLFIGTAVFKDVSGSMELAAIGTGVLVASYVFWRLSIWVLNGFFDNTGSKK